MTELQFDTLVKLMRGKPDAPGNQAARLVLIQGKSQTEAARMTGASQSNVSMAVQRYSEAYQLVCLAFIPTLGVPVKNSPRGSLFHQPASRKKTK